MERPTIGNEFADRPRVRRAGNGAMEVLAAIGDFAPPSLRSRERLLEYGLAAGTAVSPRNHPAQNPRAR